MKLVLFCLFGLSCISLSRCEEFYFEERFQDSTLKKWTVSKLDEDTLGKFEVAAPKDVSDGKDEKGLKTTQDAKFYRMSTVFDKPLSNKGEDLCVQFTVAHEQNIDCGGGYIKLFGEYFEPEKLDGNTPYAFMFGPDICGFDKSLVHFIVSYKDKNHLIKKEIPGKRDENTHLYTLILKTDNTYEVKIDLESVRKGSLVDDFDILPPKTINDPSVSKPSDWVDEKMISDPSDTKPEDWDKPETIEDPEAKKPDDWDDEMDGEWAHPTIPNPDFKGEWTPKMIKNPLYKGEWEHPQVPNPEFTEEPELYARTMSGIGFDLWQVKSGSLFGNMIISTSLRDCEEHTKFWLKRSEFEKKLSEKRKAESEESMNKQDTSNDDKEFESEKDDDKEFESEKDDKDFESEKDDDKELDSEKEKKHEEL